jgi:2-keto-4-pentenoate hydratase/2-oxohepta-3-ene-1,7-dioic acid hydratase in catechol pathway
MQLVRYERDNIVGYGMVMDGNIHELHHGLFGPLEPGGYVCRLADARLLAPVEPSKIVAVGLNYADHAAETGMALPAEPLIFIKPPTSVIAQGEAIVYPDMSRQVDFEAELCIVIGKLASQVSEAEALDYVLGYTCGNDVTARDLQRKDGQWTRSKGFDTFCPLGPWIVTGLDPSALDVEARLNGVVKQHSNTKHLIFKVPRLISHISHIMTLWPGDVIMTGTPSGIGPMQPGDTIEVEVQGIGVLRNTIRK